MSRCGALASLLLLLAGLAWAGAARADSLRLRFEPSYANVTTESTDPFGATSTLHATTYGQRTLANYENRIMPLLRLQGFGTYESALTVSSQDRVPGETDSRLWAASGQLVAGDQVLSGTLSLDRNQRSEDALQGGVSTIGSDRIRQTLMLHTAWRPTDFPWLTLRVGRTHQFDERREQADLTTDEVAATAALRREHWELRYRFSWQNPVDHLSGTDTKLTGHGGRASYEGRLLDDRLSVYGSYDVVHRTTDTTAAGTSGTVSTQQIATQGLSAVEVLPAVPTRVTLAVNQPLIDGDTAAGAGLDLGFGATGTDYRDVGAQLPDAISPVNAIYLWVDRPLPQVVAAAFAFEAYRSDDNLTWTAVALAGPVIFGAFQSRFEIPVAETRARYLKVVARPLRVGVTIDQRYEHLFVTEIQLFQVVPAASVRGRNATLRGTASGTARLRILEGRVLAYELSTVLGHDSGTGRQDRFLYTVSNGLLSSLVLRPNLNLDSRLERTDIDSGQGKETLHRLSASLGWQPLSALGGSLTYTGQHQDGRLGRELSNVFLLSGRAEPYGGITLFGNLGYGLRGLAAGRTGTDLSALLAATLVPNSWLTLTGGYSQLEAHASGGSLPDQDTSQTRLEVTATLSPFPALLASGGVSRLWISGVGQNLYNLAVTVAPFPGGDLFLGFLYTEMIDERTQVRTRNWGPALRWKIHGATTLDAAYTVLDGRAPAQDVHTEAFTARLSVALP